MIPRRFFWIFDLIILGAAFLIAYHLVPYLEPFVAQGGPLRLPGIDLLSPPTDWTGHLQPLASTLWIFLTMAPATTLFMEVLGGYGPLIRQSRARILATSLLAPLTGLSLVTLILFALKSPAWSRLFIFSFLALSASALGLYRAALRYYFHRRQAAGYYARNVALIGAPAMIDWLSAYFAGHVPASSYRLYGFLCLCPEAGPGPGGHLEACQAGGPLERLGRVSELGALLIRRPIHEVIVCYPATGGGWLNQVSRDCDYFRAALRIVPDALLHGDLSQMRRLYRADQLGLPAISLVPPHLDSEQLFLKRILDILISAALLILLTPIFLLIGLAIKITTPHLPVLYPWRVVGQNGVEFTGYKFTTMQADADEQKARLMQANEMDGPVFKIRDDPRVTRLGRILRKFSLNELPQLWSVFKGDMSLVGPRPAFRHELERYEFWQKRKLSIRPGITCLWQVRGRNKISSFDEWVRMDLEYIDNWSLWLDLKILVRTAWVVVAGSGW